MHEVMHGLIHSGIETLKLLPFLFLSFIIMEVIEHKLNSVKKLKRINKFGPLAGSVLGLIPQCGFSVVASNLYAGRVITLGTLFSIYLVTSDEMIPIMVANNARIDKIGTILFLKFILGLFFGLLVDIFYKSKLNNQVSEICVNDDCHCKDGILKSSIIHTLKIALFILIINIIINFIVDKEWLLVFANNNKILSPIVMSLIGLIPNCVSSVLITELYLSELITLGSCISGLLCGSGLGILVLFKQNKNLKENLQIVFTLIVFSSICGIVLNYLY